MYVANSSKSERVRLMSYLKGKSTLMLLTGIGISFQVGETFLRGYYVSTVGNVNEETIINYIRNKRKMIKAEIQADKRAADNGGHQYQW